jgi:pyruvate/2-oxoglutarate dehydrogenase complex dihydrolipoamide dehydrogenase (E3) component
MSVDYDLIIIGSTPAGVAAAIAAVSCQARVALISDRWQVGDQGYLRAFTQAQPLHPDWKGDGHVGLLGDDRPWGEAAWLQALGWAETIATTLEDTHSPAVLSALGVEVIEAAGEFCQQDPLTFRVKNRLLRSRAFLLAPAPSPIVPAIAGLDSTHYLSTATLRQFPLATRPKSLVVIGSEPTGTVFAQTLARWGCQVTIVTQHPHLLWWEDPQVAHLIQAQLEAEGVQVLTQTQVTQVREIQAKKWVQAGNRAIETDEILLATGLQPQVASLNLAAVGVHRLTRNQKLQTANPRIYLCGDSALGNAVDHLAQVEAKVAVKNALFLRKLRLDDRTLPHIILTDPEVARVGLTVPQAKTRYGKQCLVLQKPLKSLAKAQIQDETTGFCQFIVHRNGKILGVHLVAKGASEVIGTIALALQQNLKIDQIASLTLPSPTLAEVFSQTAEEWQRQQYHQKRDWFETYFNLRRAWSG